MTQNHDDRIEASHVDEFKFPYLYRFAGQATDEEILFVTRENKIMLHVKRISVLCISILLVVIGFGITSFMQSQFENFPSSSINAVILAIAAVTLFVGWFYLTYLWKKSMVFVTTKRLKKIIYTTPINKHSLSLPLEMIVDTGSYSKGFLQALLNLGTFTARSSASSSGAATDDTSRVNKKYFYIENVAKVEDLHHYITKVLSAYRKDPESINNFRPFIPELKGNKRREFMQDYPEYWS